MSNHVHDSKSSGWIGVDLDGTLAEYHGWVSPSHIGKPIAKMVERVKAWLQQGKDVRIFTARVFPLRTWEEKPTQVDERSRQAAEAHFAIQQWCMKHIGCALPITCIKDYAMVELWDDRAVQIVANTGIKAIHWVGGEAK